MAQSDLEVSNAALYKLGEKSVASLGEDTKAANICTARVDICKRAMLRKHPWNFATKRSVLEPTWTAITGANSNGGLIRILTASTGSLASGDRVTIHEVEGTTEANGTFVISSLVANTSITLAETTFTNAWTSGGEWTPAARFDYTYSIALPSDCLRVLMVNDYQSAPDWRIERGRILINSDENNLKYIYDVTDYTTMPVDFYEALALYLAIDLCLPLSQSDGRKEELKKHFKTALAEARFVDSTEDPAQKLDASEWIDSRFTSPHSNSRDYYAQG
jgi:hypothetical protein